MVEEITGVYSTNLVQLYHIISRYLVFFFFSSFLLLLFPLLVSFVRISYISLSFLVDHWIVVRPESQLQQSDPARVVDSVLTVEFVQDDLSTAHMFTSDVSSYCNCSSMFGTYLGGRGVLLNLCTFVVIVLLNVLLSSQWVFCVWDHDVSFVLDSKVLWASAVGQAAIEKLHIYYCY